MRVATMKAIMMHESCRRAMTEPRAKSHLKRIVAYKKHQEFFEGRKAQEQENLDQKTAICEIIESFNIDELKTFADWNKLSEQITQLQAKWKTIGFAPQKHNVAIYERFRAACDNFFNRKAEFFKEVRNSLADNLRIKRELCEKAEALKDSTLMVG